MSNLKQSLHTLYSEREKFIVIGLTGRTGSGCSTTADTLTKNIDNIDFPKPNHSQKLSIEDRKYKIIFQYITTHWKPFIKISVKDILTYCIVENSFDEFISFIESVILKNEIEINLSDKENIKKIYELYRNKIIDFKGIADSNSCEIKIKSEQAYELYINEIPILTKKLIEFLNSIKPEIYTKTYQIIGDNLRFTGKAFNSKDFDENAFYLISNKINKIIKAISNLNKDKSNYFVIDAIRNPYEALFFRDRYSAFYLVSVNAPENVRVNRLRSSRPNLSNSQIEELDKKEYSADKNNKFISQDLQKCIEISDIHFNNPELGVNNYSNLKKQIAKYISLIIHPGLVTPTAEERCMQIAYSAKLNSGCISRQIGAVITDQDYSIKSIGWNSTPEGQVPCLLRNVEDLMNHDDSLAFSSYESNNVNFREMIDEIYPSNQKNTRQKDLNGRNLSFCFKDLQNTMDNEKNQVHTRALHAEENAFLQISKYGGDGIKGGILFSTASPCELCSKKSYQLGIKRIIYIDPYPGISKEQILECGSMRPEFELFHGAIAKAYHQLYYPIMPFKDEISMLIKTKKDNKNISELSEGEQIENLKRENKLLKEKLDSLNSD